MQVEATNSWCELQLAAWKGDKDIVSALTDSSAESPAIYHTPLYLALSRWGHSSDHQEMIEKLWNKNPAPEQIRWGDTAWGGQLTLLELAADKNIPGLIGRCVKAGLKPEARTWAMAGMQENPKVLVALAQYFPLPDTLCNHPWAGLAQAERMAGELETTSDKASGDARGTRRL